MWLNYERLGLLFLTCTIATSAACHPGPVLNTGSKPPAAGGTIAGIVTSDSKLAVPGRKVTAIETTTRSSYDATTAVNGGYTIKVPEGTYRIELELRTGETLVKEPSVTHVNASDLDPQRDFVIACASCGRDVPVP
jgi:hypothetical protein